MTARRMNREARRAMAAKARDAALRLAGATLDYDQSGRVVRVVDPRAQAALVRAFERMLRAGGAPQVLRLSDEAASAFPRGGQPPQEGATAWLAVGVDCAGLASYSLRWLPAFRIDPTAQRAFAEAMLLSALAVECARPGFPAGGRA
jgi:hypothetical protein